MYVVAALGKTVTVVATSPEGALVVAEPLAVPPNVLT